MCSVVGVGALLAVAATAVSSNQSSRKVTMGSTSVNTAPVDSYVAKTKANYARAEGDRTINEARNRYLQSEGQVQSTLAAGNVSLGSGSAIDLLVNNRGIAQRQMNTLRHQSDVNAWEYDVAGAKADARNVVQTAHVEQDSWQETLTDPLFMINTTRKGLSLFGKVAQHAAK